MAIPLAHSATCRPSSAWCCLALLLISGCGSSSTVSDARIDRPEAMTLDAAITSDGSTIADATDDPASPVVLVFSTSSTSLTEHQSVTFTAVVTDPNGIDDVIGGVLLSADEETSYGAFATAASEGAYTLTLSWEMLNQTTPINFDTEAVVVFVAVLFDQAGHRASRTTTLRLHCGGVAACAGVCVDLQSDAENCGGCGMTCDAPCLQGRCHGRAPCAAVTATMTCDRLCAARDQACAEEGCGLAALAYDTADACLGADPENYRLIETCDAELWTGSAGWVSCCCTP